MNPRHQTYVRIPQPVWERIVAWAGDRGMSINAAITHFCVEQMKAEPSTSLPVEGDPK